MGKKNNQKMWMALVAILVIVLVFGYMKLSVETGPEAEAKDLQQTTDAFTTALNECPDDGDTTITLTAQNIGNTTGIETFDAEWTMLGSGGSKVTGTTSTADDHTVNCGETYEFIIESADGSGGDNSNIIKVLEGQGATRTDKGSVLFTPTKSSYSLIVGLPQHGTLETKVYDNDDARYAYDTGDAGNSEYEADGTTFRDGDNATAFALSSAGDFLDMNFKIRTVEVDTEFCDHGCFIAVEAPVTEYDEPVLRANGQLLNEVKGTALNADELKQLSNYEYVFELPGTVDHKGISLSFYIEANTDASTDVEVDFVARGVVDSLDGVSLLTSTAQDDSGATTVYAVQDFTLDVS